MQEGCGRKGGCAVSDTVGWQPCRSHPQFCSICLCVCKDTLSAMCCLAMLKPHCAFPLGLLERRVPGQQKQIVMLRHGEKKNKENNPHLQALSVLTSACLERIRYAPRIVRQLCSVSYSAAAGSRIRCTPPRCGENADRLADAHAGKRGGHVSRLAVLAGDRRGEMLCVPLRFCVVYS